MWANASIIVAAGVYFAYNCRVVLRPESFQWDELYRSGDQWYLANAIFYLLAAARDCGCFWFMPAFGLLRRQGHLAKPECVDLKPGKQVSEGCHHEILIAFYFIVILCLFFEGPTP